jgi:hypothetical protein
VFCTCSCLVAHVNTCLLVSPVANRLVIQLNCTAWALAPLYCLCCCATVLPVLLHNCTACRTKGRGRILTMTLDTANVTTTDSSLNLRWLYVFFTQGSQVPGWQSKMGTARVNCISGCECAGTMFGGKAAGVVQSGINLGYAKTQVCVVQWYWSFARAEACRNTYVLSR